MKGGWGDEALLSLPWPGLPCTKRRSKERTNAYGSLLPRFMLNKKGANERTIEGVNERTPDVEEGGGAPKWKVGIPVWALPNFFDPTPPGTNSTPSPELPLGYTDSVALPHRS